MKFIIGVLAATLLSSSGLSQASPKVSWFLYDEGKKAWCGYTNEALFQDKADKLKPLESARVTLVSGVPSEITYQVQPESGDWVMADKYIFSLRRIDLKRVTIYAQNGVQVSQHSIIRNGAATKLQLISVKNVDGSTADISGVDVPSIYIKTGVGQFRFLPIAQTLAKRPAAMLCGSPGKP